MVLSGISKLMAKCDCPCEETKANAPRCEHECRRMHPRMQLRFFQTKRRRRKRRQTHQGVNTNAGGCTLECSCVCSKHTFVLFSNAVRSLQTQARTCHDHNIQQEQFSVIYCHYGIRKSVQMLITVVSLQTLKLWQTSVTSLGKLLTASPETNFRFFNSTMSTNLQITFALVLNNVTCDKTTSPLSFAFKFP